MAIREMQRSLIKQHFIQEQLREGLYPSVMLVDQLTDEMFRDKPAGVPRFTYRPMIKGQASSSEDYNSLFNEISIDLTVGFEEVVHLNNRVMSLTSYYESHRTRVDKELKNIELKIAGLQMKSEAKTNVEVVGDQINNFLDIDFRGDMSRNIPKTDAFVNLRQNEVEVKRMKNSAVKHDLSIGKPRFYTEDSSLQVINLTSIESALTDTIYDAWRSIVVNKTGEPVVAYYEIELPELITITNFMIDTQVGNPVYLTLLLSSDGSDFTIYESRKVTNSYQWVMEPKETKVIRLKMEKKEHDRPNGSEFEFLFGAKTIQATEQRYMQDALFVSKPFTVLDHEAIESISLDVEEYLPANTSIRYYVGLDYETNVVEWEEIRKDRPVITEMVKPYSMEINRYTTGYGDLMFEQYGQRYHCIAKLPHKPLKKSMELMIGRNMWLRETIPAPFTYEETDDASDAVVYKTGVHDWIRAGTAKKDYIRIQNRFDYLQKNMFHRYTTNLFVETPEEYRGIFSVSKNGSFAVFLNGSQVKGIKDDYMLAFKQGWNTIVVYAYSRDINEEMLLDFYIPRMSNRIFASRQPLQRVSMYDLLNNTSSRTHGKFAVDEEDNIIVNYHPKLIDIQNTLQSSSVAGVVDQRDVRLAEGIEYALNYKYSVSDKTDHKVRFMAILSKEQDLVKTSPRMKNYKLIIE